MLSEAKLAMQISTNEYDAEIASLLMAAANDLQMAGVVFEGDVTFSVQNDTIVDGCTVTNEKIKRALITYAQANANWQPDAKAERYRNSYRDQLERFMSASGYTVWGDVESEGAGT